MLSKVEEGHMKMKEKRILLFLILFFASTNLLAAQSGIEFEVEDYPMISGSSLEMLGSAEAALLGKVKEICKSNSVATLSKLQVVLQADKGQPGSVCASLNVYPVPQVGGPQDQRIFPALHFYCYPHFLIKGRVNCQ